MAEPETNPAPLNPGLLPRRIRLGLPEGWGHFFLCMTLLVGWFLFLAFQVVYQRPESPQPQAGTAILPSRAQLSTADAVWLVEIQKDASSRVLEVVAGKPSPKPPNIQLEISFLNQAVTQAKNEAKPQDSGNLWLVPVTFEKATLAPESPPLDGKAGTWKVSPLPADPSKPKGEAGRVYPPTPFNSQLIRSWWKKNGKP